MNKKSFQHKKNLIYIIIIIIISATIINVNIDVDYIIDVFTALLLYL